MALPTTNLVLRLKADTGVTSSGGRISAWTDQSPAANGDATQSTAARKPFLATDQNGDAVVRFPYGLADTGGSNDVTTYLNLPGGLSISDIRSCTVLVACKGCFSTSAGCLVQLGTWPGAAGTGWLGWYNSANYLPALIVYNEISTSPRFYLPQSKTVVGGRTRGATATDLICAHKTTVSLAATPSAAATGGRIGANDAINTYFQGDVYEILIWNAALSDVDLAAAMEYLCDTYGISQSPTNLLVCVGDSLTECTRTTDNQTWPFLCSGMDPDWVVYGAGWGGRRIGASSADAGSIRNVASTFIDDVWQASFTNKYLAIQLGTNDIGTDGTTGAQTWTRLKGLCSELKAMHGWTIWAGTIPDRNDSGGFRTAVTDYNVLIRAFNPATDSIDAIWDSGSGGDAPRARLDNANDTTYFYTDAVHCNNLGTFVISSAVYGLIKSVPYAPTAPTLDSVSGVTVTVSFTDNSTGETGFKLERRLATPTGSAWSVVQSGSASPLADNSGAGETAYLYRPRAYNGTGSSLWHGTVAATTEAAPAPSPGTAAMSRAANSRRRGRLRL